MSASDAPSRGMGALVPPHLLLADLHSRLFRTVSQWLDKPTGGLQQAGRQLKQAKLLTSKTANKLAIIEAANSIVRHLSEIGCDAYIESVVGEITTSGARHAGPEAREHVVEVAEEMLNSTVPNTSIKVNTTVHTTPPDHTCIGTPAPILVTVTQESVHGAKRPVEVSISHSEEKTVKLPKTDNPNVPHVVPKSHVEPPPDRPRLAAVTSLGAKKERILGDQAIIIGSSVEVFGLTTVDGRKFNGAIGKVVVPINGKGRVGVMIYGETHDIRTVNLRPPVISRA